MTFRWKYTQGFNFWKMPELVYNCFSVISFRTACSTQRFRIEVMLKDRCLPVGTTERWMHCNQAHRSSVTSKFSTLRTLWIFDGSSRTNTFSSSALLWVSVEAASKKGSRKACCKFEANSLNACVLSAKREERTDGAVYALWLMSFPRGTIFRLFLMT